MARNPLKELAALGQSLWLDDIRPARHAGDALRRYIEEDGLRGMTSNPSIFRKAIADGHDYDHEIRDLARQGRGAQAIYEDLSLRDVTAAADAFRPLYDGTGGLDGFASLEVDPRRARDIRGTLAEARRLWAALDRPNVLIKVPATDEGLLAIRQLLREGINVNVTLLFGPRRYRQVVEAYLAGLEDRLADGGAVERVASVASFFVSRVDARVDPVLKVAVERGGPLADAARMSLGQVAIAGAKVAFQDSCESFGSDRFQRLAARGVRPQRLLWASTGTKDPAYSDVKYVDALVGEGTIDTVPPDTMAAYRDHGDPKPRLEQDVQDARRLLDALPELGIEMDRVERQLEDEGVASFVRAFEELLAALARAPRTLTPLALHGIDACWRAANYVSVGQIYLRDNPLLRRPLAPSDVKPMLLGHWGTTPGQNFIYAHLNRVIREQDLDMIYVSGPGHGGPAAVGSTWLEGTYSEVYPDVGRDEEGLRRLFRQFSFPGGIPSHVSPECPGSIHEGGELGYSLSHAFGAAFDNPGLVVACVVGDGEAETGPLATAWHSNKFLDPVTDGAVLPILHLNGYKIANPALLARIPREELEQLFRGYGWAPLYVEGDEPAAMHEAMATALDAAVARIREIQQDARDRGVVARPCWPLIVLRSPKGWTGPGSVGGVPIEGTFRSHQVPLADAARNPAHLALLEEWLRSYRPGELFDEAGRLRPELAELAPRGDRRMGANPHANGGGLLVELRMPDFREYATDVPSPGAPGIGDTRVLGPFLRDVVRLNEAQRNFRVFGPDETLSNGLGAIFEATARQWNADVLPGDEFLAPTGRVMEMLSEHQCEGWLEGYLLTGRHGLFNCYEAFIHIVDSMFNQHAKWLKVTSGLPWRHPIASLNYLLASHVWRQDHNGFTHQDPGFIDHVVNKKAEVVRVYLPPDANCLLSVMDHCLRSRQYVNVVIAGKHPSPQWLSMDAAIAHCAAGIGAWDWAGSDGGREPDVVMACCGDVPTLETLAAVTILREHLPDLKVRVVNVVDLMKLQPPSEHPHGLPDDAFDALFTKDRPVIFAFHGYPSLVHRLAYRRTNHDQIHVRGYKEEGTVTTPFDMTVLNDLDRFHLVMDAIDRLPGTGDPGRRLRERMVATRAEHGRYIREHGRDLPEVRHWTWGPRAPTPASD